ARMKMQNYFFIILLVLGFLVLSGCDFSMSSASESTDEEKYICQVDEDCVLVSLDVSCTICDACGVDYARDEYVAVNNDWFIDYADKQRLENCDEEFVNCYLNDFEPFQDCGSYRICPECAEEHKNTHIEAQCVSGTCQKMTT
ncbi:MAG: hypothetical protein ACMXYF_04055, partial [Candidatus Woesearchaeota archaeon]